MLSRKKPTHPHYRDRREKGTTLDFRNKSAFLKPGDVWTDMNGRKYRVAADGSLRRIKNGGKHEKV
jgi:hypothetical protein